MFYRTFKKNRILCSFDEFIFNIICINITNISYSGVECQAKLFNHSTGHIKTQNKNVHGYVREDIEKK